MINWLRRKRRAYRSLQFYHNLIKENDLVFDIGANLGQRTTLFSKLGSRVVAVEPASENYTKLKEKFGANPSIHLENAGVGIKPGQQTLFISNYAELSTFDPTLKEKFEGDKTNQIFYPKSETVKIVTLDQLIEKYGQPQFCKIDVEGYEAEVLKGCSSALQNLSFEYLPLHHQVALSCLNQLKNHDYTYQFSYAESMRFSLPSWVSFKEILDYLGSQQELKRHGDVYARLK